MVLVPLADLFLWGGIAVIRTPFVEPPLGVDDAAADPPFGGCASGADAEVNVAWGGCGVPGFANEPNGVPGFDSFVHERVFVEFLEVAHVVADAVVADDRYGESSSGVGEVEFGFPPVGLGDVFDDTVDG